MRLETIIMYTMLKLEFFYMSFLKKNIFLTSNLDLKIETNQHFRQNDKRACNTRKKKRPKCTKKHFKFTSRNLDYLIFRSKSDYIC